MWDNPSWIGDRLPLANLRIEHGAVCGAMLRAVESELVGRAAPNGRGVGRLRWAWILSLILLGFAGAIATYSTVLFPLGLLAAIAAFWSNGVIANFDDDPQRAPNWAAALSLLAAIASVALLVTGLILRMM